MTRKDGQEIWILAGLATLVVAAAFGNAWLVASRLVQTSDSAQSFVAGGALLNGNLLLSGWNIPLDNYYLTDALPYAALEGLTGPQPFLLALEPVFVYALFVCVVLALCVRSDRPLARNIEACAAVAFFFAAPAWTGDWNPLLLSDMHFATVLGALSALALCARVSTRGLQDRWLCGLLVGLVAATLASDPFALVFAFGPALALLAADGVAGVRNARLTFLLLAGGTVLGLLLPSVIANAGGFTTENIVVVGFAGPQQFARNLIALAAGILTLFGANPLAADFTWHAAVVLVLRAVAAALAILAVVRIVPRLAGRQRTRLLDRFICAGALATLAACALSTQFGKGIRADNLWTGGPPMRYAMPAVLFASVLAARQLPGMLEHMRPSRRMGARRTLLLGALTTIVAAYANVAARPIWIWNNPPASVARWLSERGLRHGVGEYWSANLIAAMSGNAIRIGSVVPRDGKLAPYVLAADRNGFAKSPQFVIWQEPNLTGLEFADVTATYAVTRTERVAGYRIALLARVDPDDRDTYAFETRPKDRRPCCAHRSF